MIYAKKLFFEEKNIHLIFDISLWLKGAFAFSEIIAGIAAYFVSRQFLLNVVQWVFKNEFAQDPHDIVANFLLHFVQSISFSAQTFAAVYLLGHGVIKLWLVVGLLRQKLWYYPTSLVVFCLFIVYQLYRYAFSHSVTLLLITLLDILVIALTWHEWRYLRQRFDRSITAH